MYLIALSAFYLNGSLAQVGFLLVLYLLLRLIANHNYFKVIYTDETEKQFIPISTAVTAAIEVSLYIIFLYYLPEFIGVFRSYLTQ